MIDTLSRAIQPTADNHLADRAQARFPRMPAARLHMAAMALGIGLCAVAYPLSAYTTLPGPVALARQETILLFIAATPESQKPVSATSSPDNASAEGTEEQKAASHMTTDEGAGPHSMPAGGPPKIVPPPPPQNPPPKDQRERIEKLVLLDKFLGLPDEKLALMRRTIERIEQMTPEQRAELRERIQYFRKLKPEQQTEIKQNLSSMSWHERRALQEKWLSMSTEQQISERERLQMMTPDERHQYFRKVIITHQLRQKDDSTANGNESRESLLSPDASSEKAAANIQPASEPDKQPQGAKK